MTPNPLGSAWSRWDLHFHTPASFDYKYPSASAKEIAETLIEEGVSLVAVTDHHRIDVDYIKAMRVAASGRLTVLPGLELRSELGSDQVHYIGLFSEELDLDHLWDTLKGSLGLTPQGIADRGGDDGVYIRIPEAAKVIRDELGGLISIHAGARSNSIDRIQNQAQFQRRIKYDVAKEFIDILEIGQLKDVDRYLDVIFPATGLSHPLVVGSDNHDIRTYSPKVPCWVKAEPTFLGLMQTINEPRGRIYLGNEPPHLAHVKQNRSSYIKSVRFDSLDGSELSGGWFDGEEVALNTGLVALIGNQGSGKSAFTDAVGLLGNCPHQESFSFLHASHFRHPKDNKAEEFKATLTWQNGATTTRNLDRDVPSGAVETVRYIPQHHLDAICDELRGGRAGKFDAELRQVIFSRVPKGNRLNATTLDDLIQLRTADSKTRIQALKSELAELNSAAAELEERTSEEHALSIAGRVEALEQQLAVVETGEPQEPQPPELDADTQKEQQGLREELDAQHQLVVDLQDQHRRAQEEAATASGQMTAAQLVRAKLDALGQAVERTRDEISPLVEQLGLRSDFFQLQVDDAELAALEIRVRERSAETDALLVTEDENSLPAQLEKARTAEEGLRERLDRPGQEYQVALDARRDWVQRRNAIIGQADAPGTLEYERAQQASLAAVPAELAANHEEQVRVALAILTEKLQILKVYEELYAPVQDFIDSHQIAKDQFGLQFEAGLVAAKFAGRFLDHINQNRRGTYYGDGGRVAIEALLGRTDFQDPAATEGFLREAYSALHVHRRPDGFF